MEQSVHASTGVDEHPAETAVRLLNETDDVIRAHGAWAPKLADATRDQAERTHALSLRVCADHGRNREDVAQLRVDNGLLEAAFGLLRLGPRGMGALAARAE